MEAMYLIFLVLGLVIAFISIVAVASGEAFALITLLISGILLWIGFSGLHEIDHKIYVNRRAAIYQDLREQHWKIKQNDVSGYHETVRFDCLTLDVKKINDRWHVVVPRPKEAGGGSIILQYHKELLLRKVC